MITMEGPTRGGWKSRGQARRRIQPWVSSARPYWTSSSADRIAAGDGTDPVAGPVAVDGDRGDRLAAVPHEPADRRDHRGGAAGEHLADLAAGDAVAPLVDADPALLDRSAPARLASARIESRVTPSRIVPVSSGVTSRPSP